LLGKLKEICRRYDSQAVGRVVAGINPILAQLGELLPDRACHPVLCGCDELGGEEGAAQFGPGEESWGLDEVEDGGVPRGAGVVPRLRRPTNPETRVM